MAGGSQLGGGSGPLSIERGKRNKESMVVEKKTRRGGYARQNDSYAEAASGYQPQQDYTADPVWNNSRKRWERADAENDANYVPGASTGERN